MITETAPKIKYNGEKFPKGQKLGKAIVPHELLSALSCCLGEKDFAMYKVMLFYATNAEDFKVAEKTILDRCKISDRGYRDARKKLAEKGWITFNPKESIIVNFDKIYKDYADYLAGFETSIGSECLLDDSKQKEIGTECLSKIGTECLLENGTECLHNNITNKINNNIITEQEPAKAVSCSVGMNNALGEVPDDKSNPVEVREVSGAFATQYSNSSRFNITKLGNMYFLINDKFTKETFKIHIYDS